MDYQTEENTMFNATINHLMMPSHACSCTLLALRCAKDGMAPEEDFEMLSPGLLVRPTSQCRVELVKGWSELIVGVTFTTSEGRDRPGRQIRYSQASIG